MADGRPIIIVKKVKKVAGGHHGGAWKVAYADFVTAMMAFFLLLWLLNSTSEEQRQGIANYFNPISIVKSGGGSGGILGGSSVNKEGELKEDKSPPISPQTPIKDNYKKKGDKDMTEDEALKIIREKHKKILEDTEKKIKHLINTTPQLKGLDKNILFDQTDEGMRLQIVDMQNMTLFEKGKSKLTEKAYSLMGKISEVLAKLPNRITISGHTDAFPYADDKEYGNWELSADRANASRRALVDWGVAIERLTSVSGKADQEPLVKEDIYASPNRRISIILLYPKREAKKSN